jgi:hypothetical protein
MVSRSENCLIRLSIAPRLLTRQQAAAYCGVSVPTFVGICPVKGLALGKGKRLERFDRFFLDRWIDTFDSSEILTKKDWLAELDKNDDGGSPEGT